MKVLLDIRQLNNEGHSYLKDLFELPEYYGNNLDALYDCLDEMDELEVTVTNIEEANEFSKKVLNVIELINNEYEDTEIEEEINSMDVLDAISQRSSIRKYTEQKLSEQQIRTLVEAGLKAPTAVNKQEIHITVLKKGNPVLDEMCKALEKETNFYYDSPVFFVLSGDKSFRFCDVDGGIAVENMVLAAESMGLGSVIIGMIRSIFLSDRAEEFRKKLCFPEGYDFVIGLAVGYKDTEKPQHFIDYEGHVTEL